MKESSIDLEFHINKQTENDKVVAVAGNPNVGKSTLFNALTGLNQHTGNWPGKTVTNAQGYFKTKFNSYIFVDLPGTYSLMAHSTEEEIARNFICFGHPDMVVVICDATCLERNLNLVLQTIEISKNVLVCVNLMDEAKRKGIKINTRDLSELLGVPVVTTIAQKKHTLNEFINTLDSYIDKGNTNRAVKIIYPEVVEKAISIVEKVVTKINKSDINNRWLSLKLLDDDIALQMEISKNIGDDFLTSPELFSAIDEGKKLLVNQKIGTNELKDIVVSTIVKKAEMISQNVVTYSREGYNSTDRKIDKVLTSRIVGYPIMLLLLAFIFWLTIEGANYPSQLISDGLFWVQDRLTDFFTFCHSPDWLYGILVLGIYRVVAWVVSVMLPPMAIFFPLFTLLEDAGYLPRVAYNLDKSFKRCSACGKQALTMCMGFGCNAAGVVGCRIIDSPRERLLAIITNNFVPCNGRFPTLIAILTMFFVGTAGGTKESILSAIFLTIVILLGIIMTFLATKLLSKTLLKGVPSSFTLELPPYRKPQIGKVIVHSIFDRTLFVLGRAVAVAAPAGLIIWIMANIHVNDVSILNYCANFLEPFARLMGLDGVILIAFILGFPANEIVIPIIIMAYMSQGSILELDSLAQMKELFVNNGWTWITAISTMLFSLMHWPCSTTILTIKKETGGIKWTLLSFAIPTVIGIVCCMLFTFVAKMFL